MYSRIHLDKFNCNSEMCTLHYNYSIDYYSLNIYIREIFIYNNITEKSLRDIEK